MYSSVGVTPELPALLVNHGVMPAAEKDQVVEQVPSAVLFCPKVVDVAPGPVPVTAVELAMPVASLDGSALCPVHFGFCVGVVENGRSAGGDEGPP